VTQHLDLAAGEVGVLGAGRARAHLAHDLQAELVANAFGDLERLGTVGVADDLHQAFVCTRPSRSRRSMKITPPWSRRRWAQPIRVTVWSISASLTRPQ